MIRNKKQDFASQVTEAVPGKSQIINETDYSSALHLKKKKTIFYTIIKTVIVLAAIGLAIGISFIIRSAAT